MNSDTMLDPIAALDTMLERGEDVWETAVSIGIQNENELTVQRWLQGDLTLRVEGAYGDGIITKFATALNVNTSTLKQRRTISKFYPSDTRVSFDSIGYSHFRTAMKLEDLDKALWALEKADNRGWPIWKFDRLLNRLLGKARRNSDTLEGQVSRKFAQEDGYYITVKFESDVDLRMGQTITIRLK